jgi:hypothetical protein
MARNTENFLSRQMEAMEVMMVMILQAEPGWPVGEPLAEAGYGPSLYYGPAVARTMTQRN